MREQRNGSAVMMGSVGGSRHLPGSAAYGAAKAARWQRDGGRRPPHPARPLADPAEIGGACVFLAFERASCIK
ncbi:hypothetical protein [Streptomyces griseus]|uniref:hypothetical protein n=1 Tax=Streptomyces griseus TaxID=1911 RepID=UPI0018FED59D|nr:hypothetical protein [Streptomyces griseus]